ncbi:hypothetical protein ANCCAN_21323 [Ancylostoma caninum]|uniref:Phlebovirus glycoprotein G2 fusion domain-containing protein n=1 Tax=Ancylostoma caninum TaxID=29170 RepID=A0A368FPW2_ANCCA|nr:hypothetical protein ANCCAN_21323 [Ancylostoma caninum]
MSSGCLFYRIYVTPNTPQVFGTFHCNRWNEAAKIKIAHYDAFHRKARSFTAYMRSNVPVKWKDFSFTLASITAPPTPLLNRPFITDGNNTALWNPNFVPALSRKSSAEELEQLKKTLVDLATVRRSEEREPDKYDATVQACTTQKTAQEFVQEVQEQVQEQEPQVDDREYFERMVEEVQDEEVDMAVDDEVDSRSQSPVHPYDDEGPSSVKAELPSTWNTGSTSMELRQRTALLEEAREQLPFRTFGESSRGVEERVTCAFCNLTGVHYSDSCPNVRDGNERFDIIMRSDLCKYCLERCPYEVCKYRYRECWYCARVRGTIIEDSDTARRRPPPRFV